LFPTDTHVSDFSTARIGPAIEASPYLGRIVIDGGGSKGNDGNKVRGADRVTLKRVRNNFLYLRGAQVKPDGKAPQLKSVDADVVIYDEVDEMDPRAPSIAAKRLGHSALAEERWVSTPTYPGVGIHAKWQESDQREWFVRCEQCGSRQALTINKVVTQWDKLGRPHEWLGGDDPYLGCEKCGGKLDRLGPGEWVAAYPEREIAGFHLSKLFSAQRSLLEIIRSFDTVDETKRREAFNQELGEPYTPRGGQITDELLDTLMREYAHGPRAGERPVMGVDVGRVLHTVIRSAQNTETGERDQLFAGEVESFEALGDLVRRFRVRGVVIDALPETRKAREFQAAFPKGVVWLAYYVNQRQGTKRTEAAQWDDENGVVNLDRTRSLDAMFARFYDATNTLPGHIKNQADYYEHLKAQVRVVEDGANGEKVVQYVQAEGRPDHYAHAENYCAVAGDVPTPKQVVHGAAKVARADGLFS
jgi:hypothetical protein